MSPRDPSSRRLFDTVATLPEYLTRARSYGLSQCRAADRAVVENNLMIVQEKIPTLDVTRSALTHEGGAYHVSVP
jgi:hypothetical protein